MDNAIVIVDRVMKKKEFFIPFVGLKEGKHTFEYQINNTFFESFGYEEFNGAEIPVKAVLTKTSTMMELDLNEYMQRQVKRI